MTEITWWITKLASGDSDSSTIGEVRRRFGKERAWAFVAIASLQSKAQRKLGDGVWFVTERSLQQATPWQVAKHKAKWFAERGVYDLCCGIGGDAIWLAQRGPVVAVDTDRELLSMTKANLAARASAKKNAAVVCTDARSMFCVDQFYVHIDPDRRSGESRTIRPDQYQPPWDDVVRLVEKAAGAVVKLAPGAQLDSTISQRAQLAWISLQGSVREQSVLFGETMQGDPGSRIAISLAHDGSSKQLVTPQTDHRPQCMDSPGEFLIDPDAAIRASGLTETFAVLNDLAMIAGPSGFLTCDQLPREPDAMRMAVVGRVLWSGACDDRKLRRELRARKMYPQTIKVRGTEHHPEVLTKRLRECGEQPITLWIGRASSRRFAAITEPA